MSLFLLFLLPAQRYHLLSQNREGFLLPFDCFLLISNLFLYLLVRIDCGFKHSQLLKSHLLAAGKPHDISQVLESKKLPVRSLLLQALVTFLVSY